MGPGRRPAPQALLAAALLALLPRPGAAAPFTADASSGHIVVHAVKAGLLSGLAHDHRLLAERWRADAGWDLEGSGAFDLRIVVDASSLRETATRLGEASRALIGREVAGPEVLDAGKFPEIGFAPPVCWPPRPGARRSGKVNCARRSRSVARPGRSPSPSG